MRLLALIRAANADLLFANNRRTKHNVFMNRRHFVAGASLGGLTRGLALPAEARKQIKITGMETDLLRLPPSPHTRDAIHDLGSAAGGVALRLLTDAGLTGCGPSPFGTV